MCGPPTKAQSILYEFISQIPLLWNYENCIHAYLKSRETKEIFENQRKHPKPNKLTFEKNTKRSRQKTKQINTNQQRIIPVCRYVKI